MAIYPQIIPVTPSYLDNWGVGEMSKEGQEKIMPWEQ